MRIKCPNCHFENEPTNKPAGITFPCESCGKAVKNNATAAATATPPPLAGTTPPPLSEASSPPTTTPPQIPAFHTPPPHSQAQQVASSIFETAALFARRILKSNLHSERVSAHEVSILENNTPSVSSPIAQSYLGWRRALLWFGGICLTISTLLELPDLFEIFENRDSPGIVKFVSVIFIFAKCGAAFLAIVAALQWNYILRTRTLARLAWGCLFCIPLLLGLIPMAYFIDLKGTGVNPAMMSFQFGLTYFILLTPTLLGLFPGIVRSALTLKTMLPESQMPGWVALIIAPLYALFLCIGLVIAAQAQDFLISATFIAFIAAPVIVILNGRRLITPNTSEQMMTNITIVKRQISLAYGIGIILSFLVALRFLNKVDVSFFDVVGFISALLANLFLVTVVVSDLLITLFKEAYTRENDLRENDLLDSLTNRFDSLDEIGLTQLHAGEADLIKGLRDRFSGPSAD